jgi:transcriptional regulator with XRE-family HTH domain
VAQPIEVRSGADVGRAIAALRARAGMTQRELGELAGLDAAYISKIESGRTVTLLEHELRILRRLGARITIELPGRPDGTR